MMNYKLFEDVLRRIYQNANPDKEDDLPGLIQKYKDREGDLLQAICRKYNISDETVQQYITEWRESHTIPNPIKSRRNNGRTAYWIMALIAIAILLFCFLYNSNYETLFLREETVAYQTDGVNKAEQQDENRSGLNPSITNEQSSSRQAGTIDDELTTEDFLNLKALQEISQLYFEVGEITAALNQASAGWEYKGDGVWAKGTSNESASQMLNYLTKQNKVIWEYIFKDGETWKMINEEIAEMGYTLTNTSQSDRYSLAKTYVNGAYVVQTVKVEMTDGSFAYKIYTLYSGN